MASVSDIIVKVATALGASESKMRWRVQRIELWRKRTSRKAEVKSEQVRYAHKKCNSCRALNDKDDSVCSSCGEPLRWRSAQLLERAGLGGVATASAILVAMLVATFIAAMAAGYGSFDTRAAIVELRLTYALESKPSWGSWIHLALPFVHVSILGLLATALAMFLLGQEIEALYGRPAMLGLFAITATAGVVGHAAFFATPLPLGAHGGLLGLIGVGLAAGHRRGHGGREQRNLMAMWAVIVLGALVLLEGNIVGELIALAVGASLGATLRPESVRGSTPAQVGLGALGAAFVINGAVIVALELARPPLFGV